MYSNVIYGQYFNGDYRLNSFYMNEIPNEIKSVIRNIINKSKCILRGGMAYICITGDVGYPLKDIDLLGEINEKEHILILLSGADVVYVNKNTFDQDVISAFWREGNGYYKIDILLMDNLTEYCSCDYKGFIYKTVTAEYLWKNKIEKIVQRYIRKHNREKTENHYRVAKKLSLFLLKKDTYKCDKHTIDEISGMLFEVKIILGEFLNNEMVESFLRTQKELINKIRGSL